MPAANLLDRSPAPTAEVLAAMGFDVAHLRSMQAQARSTEFHLEQMGFDVDQLRFYAWLVGNGRNPEYACSHPDPAPAVPVVSHGH